MSEIYNNIKREINSKKTVILIVFIIFVLGLLFGSIYITVLDNNNKKEVIDSVNNYYIGFKSITFNDKLNIFKKELLSNIFFYSIILSLGLSIIGIPIIILMIFIKSFILGFSISSIFACFKFKGLKYILLLIIPSNLIKSLLNIFLGIYSINISIKLVDHAFKKKTLNFGEFMGKVFFIFMITLLIIIFISIYDAFIYPNIINIFTKTLK